MMSVKTPDRVRTVLQEISNDPSMNDGMLAMTRRVKEFESADAAGLAGVFMNPRALEKYDSVLDEEFASNRIPETASEIIVGGGLHAAIYSAVRVAEGHPVPLVIEAKDRVGGSFASSLNPSFYLNSRNRPGKGGLPGREESLNFLPGAVVQPCDLSGEEYQTNAALAFAVRTTLAYNAKVIAGHKVVEAKADGVKLDNGKEIRAARVIYATGLGDPIVPEMADGKHMMDVTQFFAMLDKPSPLQGIKRVAVIGAGDSGKTVVEALIGQGPPSRFSPAALDYVEKIDWYGVQEECYGKQAWKNRNRSRYQGISTEIGTYNENSGKLEGGRINQILRQATEFAVGFDGAYVDGARYDLVIWAGGFKNLDVENAGLYRAMGRPVARFEDGIYLIGPAAQLPQEKEPNNTSTSVPENSMAIFRYADRTAAFAMDLPELALPIRSEIKDVEFTFITPPTASVTVDPDDEASKIKVLPPEDQKEVPFPEHTEEKPKERTIRGKDKKPYKVGDLIAKPAGKDESGRYGYYGYRTASTRLEERGKVLAITGTEKRPKVKIRESNGSRNNKVLKDPKQWTKVERGKQINGKPLPVY